MLLSEYGWQIEKPFQARVVNFSYPLTEESLQKILQEKRDFAVKRHDKMEIIAIYNDREELYSLGGVIHNRYVSSRSKYGGIEKGFLYAPQDISLTLIKQFKNFHPSN